MEYLPYLVYAGYYVTALVGMFAHFLKKNIKGESRTEVKNYFRDNYRSTLLAVIATSVGFAMIIMSDTANIVSAFGIGYAFDSAFNKWEGKTVEDHTELR